MFDHVLVRYRLDQPEHNRILYQTKDLDCSLSRYMVDEAGYLWHEKIQYESEEGGMFGFQLKEVGRHTEQVPFHGDLEIYGHLTRESPDTCYMLRFLDGRVSRTALCTTRHADGWARWETSPFPPIEPRPTALVVPVFPRPGEEFREST